MQYALISAKINAGMSMREACSAAQVRRTKSKKGGTMRCRHSLPGLDVILEAEVEVLLGEVGGKALS